MKCLEKDRELRYQSARELLADLRLVERDRTAGRPTAVDEGRWRQHRWRWLLVGAAVALALGVSLWLRWRATPPPPASRIVPVTTDGGLKLAPRLSPDGERVAYSWTGPGDDN
jgi:hypothetical protein